MNLRECGMCNKIAKKSVFFIFSDISFVFTLVFCEMSDSFYHFSPLKMTNKMFCWQILSAVATVPS